jgi:hypothetical protein
MSAAEINPVTPSRTTARLWPLLVIVLVLFGAVVAAGKIWKPKGVSLKTGVFRLFDKNYGKTKPVVRYFPHPVNGEHDVHTDAMLSLKVWCISTPFDSKSMAKSTAVLADASGSTIPVKLKPYSNMAMLIKPSTKLKPGTSYTLKVTGLATAQGLPLPDFSSHFTTAVPPDPDLHFHKVALPITAGNGFTAVMMGPDHMLYAGTDEGMIYRYPILPDGTLDTPLKISSLQNANHGPRLLIGFCFDPKSTAADPILWVSHGYHAFTKAPDFSGKITRLSGPNLEIAEDVVVNLPRSYNDHVNNQPNFGPDGALYFPQGASNAAGGPDKQWGMRPEHLLTASILRLDVSKVTPGQPLDVKTVDVGGPYDPRLPGAPLTVYATGIRNAYDLVWTTDGQLYVPTNGADAGGNTPGGPGVPALNNLSQAEDDWLFHVLPGGYYGHPNPTWNHYILNGGNLTGGQSSTDVTEYPLGTKPDPEWQPAVFDFGPHVSANGVVEYLGDSFGGKLNHDLIVCRYNAGSDLICLKPDHTGHVVSTEVGIPGLTNLNAPLAITEDRSTGNLYVSEYGARCITLMCPSATADPASDDDAPAIPRSVPGSEMERN